MHSRLTEYKNQSLTNTLKFVTKELCLLTFLSFIDHIFWHYPVKMKLTIVHGLCITNKDQNDIFKNSIMLFAVSEQVYRNK